MTPRNLQVVIAALGVTLVCQSRLGQVERSRYGRILLEGMAQVEQHYLEPVDRETLFDGAMTGVMGRLDEYSAYLDRQTYDEVQVDLEQQFGGIGIQVMLDDETNFLRVTTPIVGSPAFAAGVREGDQIAEIEGQSTRQIKMEDALRRLRGRPGTKVRLGILRAGQDQPLEFLLTRAVIETETVLGDQRHADQRWNFLLPGPDRVGYIRISPMFSERTVAELTAALTELRAAQARGLVLDLRSNPGGLLDAAVGTANLFVAKGRIVSTRGRGGVEDAIYDADGGAPFGELPLVVLVNRYSASASEIVAACLQDHHRAPIVGQRTWGKGSVQNVIPLEGYDRALKLTTASYWRPSGQNIHRTRTATDSDAWGVRPDPGCEVAIDDEALRKILEARRLRDVVRVPGETSQFESSASETSPTQTATASGPAAENLPAEGASDPQLARALAVLAERITTADNRRPTVTAPRED